MYTGDNEICVGKEGKQWHTRKLLVQYVENSFNKNLITNIFVLILAVQRFMQEKDL